MNWFGASFAPSGWTHSERVTYLATELVPVLVFVGIGVTFWVLGRPTRAAVAGLGGTQPESDAAAVSPESS
jgi:hypothetical protein